MLYLLVLERSVLYLLSLEWGVLYLLAGERSVLCVGALELASGFLASEHSDGANVPTLDRRGIGARERSATEQQYRCLPDRMGITSISLFNVTFHDKYFLHIECLC